MALPVSLRDVTKGFGDLTAVDHLALEVASGCLYGLLGPNGAGKSTTMRLLTGQAIADSGVVEVLGHRLPEASKAVRARCGVVPQIDNLDDELTVAENLEVYARLYRVPSADRPAAVRRGLDLARLAGRAVTPVDELSGGMRRRLLIARGLLHAPDLVLLDEPTVGLDPQIRQDLWAEIEAVRTAGATVLMSTHYIEEAERLCDRVAIMHGGRVVAEGSPRDLIAVHVGRDVTEYAGASAALRDVEHHVRSAGLRTRRAGTALAVLGSERVALRRLDGATATRRPATLEDVFVTLTGEEMR